jgi:succinate-semialdehyde dehydrogenase/glutarate-semialdehyde dehydrogenase
MAVGASIQRPDLGSIPSGLLIGGEWQPSEHGATIPVEDPATGEVIAEIADATERDGWRALDVAAEAQPSWERAPARERGEILRAAFEAVRARREELAALISLEMGKPYREALGEVDYGGEFLRWYSEEAVRIGGDYRMAPDGATRILVQRGPVGPCLLITPWNFPLAMATRKIAPALAAGCVAILKPATQTPLTSLVLAQILLDAGTPPGVLGVLTTKNASRVAGPLIADGRIRKLSFTGSTEVGRRLIASSGDQVVRTSMELGGNAPFLVFEDADLDAAVEGALIAKMRNMGEACTAANRFLVARPVASEFARRLADRMSGMRLGHGLDPATDVGPLIDETARERIRTLIDDAVGRGAAVIAGGGVADGPGYFFQPTVLEDVDPGSDLFSDEIFGPVAPVAGFDSDDEAIAMANDTEYGLVAYAYTTSGERALRVADRLKTGMVGINRGLVSNAAAPFGGVKHSGLGREGGREGIDDYLELKYICIDA